MQLPTANGTTATATREKVRLQRGFRLRYSLASWLGLLPFLLFCLLFELLPAFIIIQGSFTDSNSGALTLNNFRALLASAVYLRAFQNSIILSLVTALIGTVVGFFAAYGIYKTRTSWLRNLLIGFSSIAANFAGIPLAFAFVSTLGVTGLITVLIQRLLHINIYNEGFSLYSFLGLVLAYTYFQLPLMVLLTMPTFNALKPEWLEAATNLGASRATYWGRVAFPIILPSLVAAAMLLFANSLGAFATAYALAQGNINLVTIQIAFAVNGNVTIDPGLANALAVGMFVVLLFAVTLYTSMLRRVSRWQER
ncbi:ABC transporter [Dictyobacter alpinus]|uniref:ABC transporter n=1 Tax=Dictyobacter alpinus TaxID=2014873 RepID=A0A402BEB1_9CHLR|nr:ABC transporter permease subunit [Dictyobacter alpinus]GCE29723.1 ABC transporter [Dictyobacter alpinus]